MKLSQQQRSYLEKRQKLARTWRYVGPLLVLGIIGLAIQFYVNTPLLINPNEVAAGLEADSIKQSSLQMMAVLLPIMFIVVFFLLIVLVAMTYAAFATEKKYLEILDGLKDLEPEDRGR